MMRVHCAWWAVAVVVLAGCMGSEPEDGADGVAGPGAGRVSFEGTFTKAVAASSEVHREGGVHQFVVGGEGWRNVVVEPDIQIDAVLVLVPPGCAGESAPCALRYDAPGSDPPRRHLVAAMAPGTWGAHLDYAGQGTFQSSRYTLTFDYVEAEAPLSPG